LTMRHALAAFWRLLQKYSLRESHDWAKHKNENKLFHIVCIKCLGLF